MAVRLEARKIFGRCTQANADQPCLFVRTIDDGKRKAIAKCLGRYASQLDWGRTIGLIDTSDKENAIAGILVCDIKAYFYSRQKKSQKIWYDEISRIAIAKPVDGISHAMKFSLKDGSSYSWKCDAVNSKTLATLFLNLQKLNSSNVADAYNSIKVGRLNVDERVEAGGLATGSRGVVNKMFDEECFKTRQGHGFTAERANDFKDRLHGKKSRIEGDNNVKNRADRSII